MFDARIAAALSCIAIVIVAGCGQSSAAATSHAKTSECAASAIGQASASLQGGTGNAVGQFRMTNTGGSACLLRGAPAVTFFTAAGKPLPVQNIGRATQATKTLMLQPGAAAVSEIQWGNGCHLPANAARVQVAWPGGTAVADVHGPTMPRCDAPSLKSHVSATAFTSE